MHLERNSKALEEIQMDYSFENLIISIISLAFVFIGGCFALWQYHKGLVYKRTEIVKDLIKNTRENEKISLVMGIIDWNEDFTYDGKFRIMKGTQREELQNISDEELFRMIDFTLSTFSYICYLRQVHTITRKEMQIFRYAIRRLADNVHISNYLYSLYHWSMSLNVDMSFSYLVKYCIVERLLNEDFTLYGNKDSFYQCYLEIPTN